MAKANPQSTLAEFKTGWGILLAATIGTAVTGASFAVTGTMMNPLHMAYGWSRGEITFALTIASVLMAIAHIPVGVMIDRYGPRSVLVCGVLTSGLGASLLGLAGPALWTWYAAYSLFSLAIVPAAAFVWFSAVVRHFQKARGLALAFALTGSGVMTALVPTIIVNLVGSYGVRGTYFILAGAFVLLMLPGALWLIPGTKPDSEGAGHGEPVKLGRAERNQILRGSLFWRLAFTVLAISLCIGILSVHLQPMLTDVGLTPQEAAHIGLFIGPSFIVGALATGVMLDRVNPRFAAATTFIVPAIASILLMAYDGNLVIGALIGLLIGVALAAPVNVISYLSSYYFAAQHFGFVSGLFFGVLGIALGVGSWLAGHMSDLSGSYASTYVMMIVIAVLATLVMVTITQRRAVPQPA